MYTTYLKVAGCFVECNGKFLMLRRSKNESGSGFWGLPAGKVESDESHRQAIIREINEETGIAANEVLLKELGVHAFSDEIADRQIILAVHHLLLNELPEVAISIDEHDDFAWLTAREIITLSPKIHGIDALLHRYELIK